MTKLTVGLSILSYIFPEQKVNYHNIRRWNSV